MKNRIDDNECRAAFETQYWRGFDRVKASKAFPLPDELSFFWNKSLQ